MVLCVTERSYSRLYEWTHHNALIIRYLLCINTLMRPNNIVLERGLSNGQTRAVAEERNTVLTFKPGDNLNMKARLNTSIEMIAR